MRLSLLSYLTLLIFPLSCSFMANPTTTYQVKKIKKSIQITGEGKDKQWKKANQLGDFSYPWRKDTPPKTVFKALYNETHFYFLYRAQDAQIGQKVNGLKKRKPVQSDRVELFFKGMTAEDAYYSLELDALGRILDTKANFYKKIDFDWTWPTNELVVKASIDDTGYWVEGSISFASLRALGLYHDDGILRTGLYRANYLKQADGTNKPHWISWIHPDSETPNFHIPSSFGTLELEQ